MKPVRYPGHLQWIRSLPCCVCRTTRAVEAAHTGPHGLSQKSSDLSTIPLCGRHHRTGKDSYHKLGPRKFAEVHQLNIAVIVVRLSAKWVIRVKSGAFVGSFGDEEYFLGRTELGIAQAIRRMYEFRREIEARWFEVGMPAVNGKKFTRPAVTQNTCDPKTLPEYESLENGGQILVRPSRLSDVLNSG